MDNRKYDISKDSISIGQFVSQYLDIKADCSNLKHQGLRSFNSPLVVGVSNNYADKNPELIKKGILLIVLDCKKNRGTYINPLKLKDLINRELVLEEVKELMKIRINNLDQISDYFKKYEEALQRQEEMERFYHLVEDLNKTENIERIRKQDSLINRLYSVDEKGEKKI